MMYQPTSKYETLHNHDAVKVNHKQSSNLLPSLQNCNKSKQQSCICSTTTSTSQIQSNIYLQQQPSRSNGYFNNMDQMINNNSSYQLYRQHSFLDSVLTLNNNNNNGLLELDNTFPEYSTNIQGTEQILMILMCNGMTPEFDQFNGKFNSPTFKYSTNRLRIENSNTNCGSSSSSGTTPSSSSSTTPSSSISSPNCNDNLKSHLESSNTFTIISREDICEVNDTCTSPKRESISSNNQQDQYLSESSNKLDENLTLPPSPCVSDISEQHPSEEIAFQQITTTTDQNLIPHKIESVIHDSIESCHIADDHGETTDESSDEEIAPKAKYPKRETLSTAKSKDQQKTMKQDLSVDSAESSGLIIKPSRTYSFRDATIFVLSQIGKPMTAVDITKNIFDNKMVKSAGKTPERTVAAMIYQEMKKKKNSSEFALFGSGLFGLSAWKSDDHTSQDTASVSTDASLSSVDRVDKKKEKKKKRKLAKPEKEEVESDHEVSASRRKPRRMHKHKQASSSSSSDHEISISDSEETTSSKKRKHNESEETAIVMTEEALFKTYISKLKKKEETESDEDECFVCKNGGDLICCDFKGCRKVYHALCVGLKDVPQGDWICPHHYCAECKKKSFRSKSSKKCFSCPFSVCGEHGSLLKDKIDNDKFVCSKCKPLCDNIK